MNIAEGNGPKQVKRTWPTGQFVSIYGNGSQANVNPAAVPYPAAFSGGQVGAISGSSSTINYTSPGAMNPGLNLNVNGNAALDVSFICAPDAAVTLQDIQSITVALNAESGWSGTSAVALQGTYDRYTPNAYYTSISGLYNSTNWTTIVTGSVTTANSTVLLKVPVASGVFYNAYRIIASGGTGIIDWTIPGMFLDLSAKQVGQEAIWANGNIGQANIQDNDVLMISGGAVAGYTENVPPLSNIQANTNYIGR